MSASNVKKFPVPAAFKERQFKPGQSGNPTGRAKGLRNLLSSRLYSDILWDYANNGAGLKAIVQVRERNPGLYAQLLITLVRDDASRRSGKDADETARGLNEAEVSELVTKYLFRGSDGAEKLAEQRAREAARLHPEHEPALRVAFPNAFSK